EQLEGTVVDLGVDGEELGLKREQGDWLVWDGGGRSSGREREIPPGGEPEERSDRRRIITLGIGRPRGS
ncbi:hypothetical protein L6R46_29035, partial [Myxococcota bacterium]|nr:hypothetical protein [Myxococcota bacterium]